MVARVSSTDHDSRYDTTLRLHALPPGVAVNGSLTEGGVGPVAAHVDGYIHRGTGSNHITLNWPSGVQELFDAQGWSATNDPYGLDSRGEGEGVPTPETYQRAMRKRQVWVEQLLAVPELGLG